MPVRTQFLRRHRRHARLLRQRRQPLRLADPHDLKRARRQKLLRRDPRRTVPDVFEIGFHAEIAVGRDAFGRIHERGKAHLMPEVQHLPRRHRIEKRLVQYPRPLDIRDLRTLHRDDPAHAGQRPRKRHHRPLVPPGGQHDLDPGGLEPLHRLHVGRADRVIGSEQSTVEVDRGEFVAAGCGVNGEHRPKPLAASPRPASSKNPPSPEIRALPDPAKTAFLCRTPSIAMPRLQVARRP